MAGTGYWWPYSLPCCCGWEPLPYPCQRSRKMPWRQAAEVTFECEPGTLQRHKLETLKEMGVTRLSLGVENFDPKILESVQVRRFDGADTWTFLD